tara:strand:- start:877 stop:1056 length:180 start_codon:yes stop_codon:yes gene_type:complete
MQNQTLNTMILNTGLEMELDPENKEKRYNELIRDTRNILECNEIEAIKIILKTLINQGK